MAGRRVAGIGQLLLAVAGFAMVMRLVRAARMSQIYNELVNDAQPQVGSAGWERRAP